MRRINGVLSLVMCAAFFVSCQSQRPVSADDEYAVLSAYLSVQIRSNPHDFGSGHGLVLIQNSSWAIPSTDSLRLASLPADLKHLDHSTIQNFVRANQTSTTFQQRFSLPTNYLLASEADIRDHKARGDYGYVVLSHVGFSDDGSQGLFYVGHYCGLCGGLGYVLMRKNEWGHWKVQDEHFPVMF